MNDYSDSLNSLQQIAFLVEAKRKPLQSEIEERQRKIAALEQQVGELSAQIQEIDVELDAWRQMGAEVELRQDALLKAQKLRNEREAGVRTIKPVPRAHEWDGIA
jgi:chromosome segregation ATPase